MPLTPRQISSVTSEQAADAAAYARDYLQETAADVDARRGSAVDLLVVRPHAELLAAARLQIEREVASRSLLRVSADPELADPETLDALLSNYRITRRGAGRAAGQVLLRLNSSATSSIRPEAAFRANGFTFRPAQSYYLVNDPGQVASDSTRLIRTVNASAGIYTTVIDVIADTPGAGGNLAADTQLAAEGSSLPLGLQEATAAGSFGGGRDEETNAELVERARTGIATEGAGCRNNIRALIVNNFPSVRDLSVVGAGDPELLRSRSNALGIAVPGYADIYVATRPQLDERIVTVRASLVDTASRTWEAMLPQEDAAGVYRVLSVRRSAGAPDPTPALLDYTFDAAPQPSSSSDVLPYLAAEAHVYSRYQSLRVRFQDYALPDATDMLVDLRVLYAPQISTIHDLVNSRRYRSPGADYLVRAAVPCQVNVDLEIVRGQADVIPDTLVGEIKAAVVSAVHATDFAQNGLAVSRVMQAVQPLLPGRSEVRGVPTLRGTILSPVARVDPNSLQDNGRIVVQSTGTLRIPSLASRGVSPRTTMFFCDSTRVSVVISPPDQLEI
jgi:hypothetical protein